MIEFHTPQIIDRDWVCDLLSRSDFQACDYNFANMFFWRGTYGPRIARVGDFLMVHLPGQGSSYLYPAGDGELTDAVRVLGEDAASRGEPLRLVCLTHRQVEHLSELYPGRISCTEERDRWDYIYGIDQMADLGGKKLHAKRNHINRFLDNNPDWMYEQLTAETLYECVEMDRQWYLRTSETDEMSDNRENSGEGMAIHCAVEYWNELKLEGGLIRVNGNVIAFTIGDRLNSDTFDVHFEKAYGDVQGAYAIINREFARQIRSGHPEIRFLNREEDMGIEGLRKAKESYYPIGLVEKYTVMIK